MRIIYKVFFRADFYISFVITWRRIALHYVGFAPAEYRTTFLRFKTFLTMNSSGAPKETPVHETWSGCVNKQCAASKFQPCYEKSLCHFSSRSYIFYVLAIIYTFLDHNSSWTYNPNRNGSPDFICSTVR